MSYSSFEKDKKLMESWRKFSKEQLKEEQVQLNVVEEEQLEEVAPAVLAIWGGVKVLAGFVATVVPLVVANRKAIKDAAEAILKNPQMHPKIKKFAELSLAVVSPFEAWDSTVALPLEDAKDPKKLLGALASDLKGQIPDDAQTDDLFVGTEPAEDDIPPGLEEGDTK